LADLTIPLIAPRGSDPSGGRGRSRVVTDPQVLEGFCQDAAALRGSGAAGLLAPHDEADLCAWLRENPDVPVLAQGALTSLTGGATPDGDILVSTRRLDSLRIHPDQRTVTVGAGVLLSDLQATLAEHGLYYPPAPTHDGATIGGNAATNAAGGATFKYGTTRDWVTRLRVVLRHGEVLELHRGENQVNAGDRIHLKGSRELVLVLPGYQSPRLKKCSAGYHCASPMELIDLFLGSEGTLGIITELDLRVVRKPQVVTGLAFFPEVERGLRFAGELRLRSLRTRKTLGRPGLDVRSIELFDRGCLNLLAAEGKLYARRLRIPSGSEACLLFEVELDPSLSPECITDLLVAAGEPTTRTAENPLGELWEVLEAFGVVETCEVALPDSPRRRRDLCGVREDIPLLVSEWVTRHKRQDPAVHKVGGDMIVPFPRFEEMLRRYYEAFRSRGLEVVVYGHISDGNVHPNALPRSAREVRLAEEALLELAEVATSLGGSPLSEHGVGKHPLKKTLLARFWGEEVLGEMRGVKAALDPGWTLGRGVLFDPPGRR
jgi:D-lactate dehydrogenase (cytochrome)